MTRARKVSFSLEANPVSLHVLAIARGIQRGGASPALHPNVARACIEAARDIRTRGALLGEWLTTLADAKALVVEGDEGAALFDDDDDDAAAAQDAWIPHRWEVSKLDLVRLFAGPTASRRVYLFASVLRALLREGPFTLVNARLGAARCTPADLYKALEEYSAATGVSLDGRASEPRARARKESRARTRARASRASYESHAGLSEPERFFLVRAALGWPIDRAALAAAWRALVLLEHPDRNTDAEAAHHRFVLLKRGYDALCARVDGV